MNEILEAAIGYAARGWIVHQLTSPTSGGKSPGKRPLDGEWQKVTTPPTEAKLKEWFGNGNPKGHNIGLLCGEVSGVTVIDLDRTIYADIFDGVDTLRSARTTGRSHVYFKYNPRLPASKHHDLGIEVLAAGNNAVMPPSTHESGDVYAWADPDAPLATMPEEIEVKLTNLFNREKELKALVRKCRPCFKRLFKKDVSEATDFHGAEGRELMVAWGADLKAAGATLADAEMWARIIYGDGFDIETTVTEWRHIDEKKTWRCETVAEKLGWLIECDCEECGWKAPTATEAAKPEPPKPESNQTERLIELGKQDTVFFHTPDDTCYAAVKLETGGSAVIPVTTKGTFAKILRQRYYNATGKAPAGEPLKTAITTLESNVWGNGDVRTLHNRVARQDGSMVYDLTNTNYEAVEITSQGWGLLAPGHTLFRRYTHQTPQAMPVRGGDPMRMFEFVNVRESNRLLTMVYLISCFVPGIAHVIPIITGEHGAAKTTASRMFKMLVDPSAMDVISLPTNEDRLNQLLAHHWFVIFDNIDWIQRWQSDTFCRASSGQSTATRAHYTNEDDVIFKYKMCVGLNGINNAATKPDLLDRAIFLELDPIPDGSRIRESDLFLQFGEAVPEILGGIFDVISKTLLIYPTIHLDTLPRMADFALWGSAIAEALGHTKEAFLDAYYENIGRVNRAALEASPVAVAVMAFMEDRAEWEGTPAELLRELDFLAEGLYIDIKSKAWVKSPDSLGRRMKTVIPNLRKAGVGFERVKSGRRTWRIFYLSKEVSNVSNVSTDSEKPQKDKCPTCPTCPTAAGVHVSTCPESGHLCPSKNQQQANHLDTLDTLDTLAVSSNIAACGKCGCKLTGQTFRGPAGLGMICADCQEEFDRTSGLGVTTDEKLLIFVRSAIYQVTSSDRPTFDPARVLMKLKGRTDDATIERVIACFDTHAADLKIKQLPNGEWRTVSA